MFLELWLPLLSFLSGWVVGWIQTKEPLTEQVKVLQSMLSLAREKNLELAEKIRWLQAKVKAQESDLKRMNQKLERSHLGSGMEAPQWNMSYWRFEGPKLQARILELESELESLRSKTLWKD